MPHTIRRVSTTRAGGVSAPPFDSFNLGDHVGDDPAAVAANRRRLADTIGVAPDHLIWMNQVHGDTVVRVDEPRGTAVDDTDALITTTAGLALAVITADCVPVLLGDEEAGVIGAVHAGRVGAAKGIVARTVEAMVAAGAQVADMTAWLGPAVSGANYEVPAEMADDVEAALPGSRVRTAAGTPGLDLRAGIARQLGDLGLGSVAVDPRCTVADTDLFSHRRGAPTGLESMRPASSSQNYTARRTGRLASVVWMQ